MRTYFKISGVINLATAMIHLIAGQIDLVNPLSNSNLEVQQKAEWISVWHIITILLFFSSYIILKAGFGKMKKNDSQQMKTFGVLYVIIGVPFVFSSLYFSVFAPQFILLMPIGILIFIGLSKQKIDVK